MGTFGCYKKIIQPNGYININLLTCAFHLSLFIKNNEYNFGKNAH